MQKYLNLKMSMDYSIFSKNLSDPKFEFYLNILIIAINQFLVLLRFILGILKYFIFSTQYFVFVFNEWIVFNMIYILFSSCFHVYLVDFPQSPCWIYILSLRKTVRFWDMGK